MNDRNRIMTMAAVLCCGVAALTAVPIAARAASLVGGDRDFLISTAQGATYELAVARLALTKATRPDIKDYAHTMIADHTSLNPRLHQLAQQDHVPLPTTMTDDKRKSYDQLKGLDGKAFDDAFVAAETRDNKSDIADETKEADATSDPQVEALVERLRQADMKHAKIGEALQQAGQ